MQAAPPHDWQRKWEQNNGLASPDDVIPANRFSADEHVRFKQMPLPNHCCGNTDNYTSAAPFKLVPMKIVEVPHRN